MKLFDCWDGRYHSMLILASTWVEAIELLKKGLFPKWLTEDSEEGREYKEYYNSLDYQLVTTFPEIKEVKLDTWYIKEIDLTCPGIIQETCS